jgi:carbon storage regulator CsrA
MPFEVSLIFVAVICVSVATWLLRNPVTPVLKRSSVMLVLSRKVGESIMIDVDGLEDPIEVTVVETRGGRVRLGLKHPEREKVRVLRKELVDTDCAVAST